MRYDVGHCRKIAKCVALPSVLTKNNTIFRGNGQRPREKKRNTGQFLT